MSNKTIVLVSCVSLKQEISSKAEDLYISPLFKKAKLFAQTIGNKWYILSAKYGVVNPSQIIEPYELTLNTMKTKEIKLWADKVLIDLFDVQKVNLIKDDIVIFLAGDKYRKFLTDPLKAAGVSVHIPLEGHPIGVQLSMLKEWADKYFKNGVEH